MASGQDKGRVDERRDEQRTRAFTAAVLRDIRALAEMLERGMIERGVHRIGAEQEVFLVDRSLRPAPVIADVLARLDPARFSMEIARFQLELGVEPELLGGRC